MPTTTRSHTAANSVCSQEPTGSAGNMPTGHSQSCHECQAVMEELCRVRSEASDCERRLLQRLDDLSRELLELSARIDTNTGPCRAEQEPPKPKPRRKKPKDPAITPSSAAEQLLEDAYGRTTFEIRRTDTDGEHESEPEHTRTSPVSGYVSSPCSRCHHGHRVNT